jgi:hypothetical protein
MDTDDVHQRKDEFFSGDHVTCIDIDIQLSNCIGSAVSESRDDVVLYI